MHKVLLGVSMLVSMLVLASCASNEGADENSKVASLVNFDRTLKMKLLWSSDKGRKNLSWDTGVGTAKGRRNLRLSAPTSAGKDRKYLRFVPAVANNVIFTAETSGKVNAYDVESGKRLWRVSTGYDISGALSASNDIVVFGTYSGKVVALNSANGEQLWEAQTSSEILAPPSTNGSIVVAQTIDARVFTFDAKTGKQRWSYDHLAPVLSLRGTSAPLITPTQVICAFDNGQLVSFSSSDGSRTWAARVSQPKGKTDLERIVDVDGTPLEQSGIVYAGSYQGNLMALSRGQGTPIWRKPLSTYQSLTVASGKVFVSTERSRVIAYNTANGDVLWQNENLLNRGITGPTVIGEYLVVVDDNDYLHVISQEDGSFAYRFQPVGNGFHSPLLTYNGKLYVLSDDGVLSAYEIVDP